MKSIVTFLLNNEIILRLQEQGLIYFCIGVLRQFIRLITFKNQYL
jgi:hypothetical protein